MSFTSWVLINVVERNERTGCNDDRSPCIIRPDDYDLWLDPEFDGRAALEALLQPPDESIEAYPVSAAVGNVRNQGPELAERVDA